MIQPATLSHLANIGPLSTNGLGDWSNFLGPIEGAGAFAAAYVLARKHNCHVKGCMRLGRFPIEGTGYVVCNHHHPKDKPTHAVVLAASAEAHRIKTHRAKVAHQAELHWAAADAVASEAGSPGAVPVVVAPHDQPTDPD
jgi:hypothetical protein